jgi:hypothetical protein
MENGLTKDKSNGNNIGEFYGYRDEEDEVADGMNYPAAELRGIQLSPQAIKK